MEMMDVCISFHPGVDAVTCPMGLSLPQSLAAFSHLKHLQKKEMGKPGAFHPSGVFSSATACSAKGYHWCHQHPVLGFSSSSNHGTEER